MKKKTYSRCPICGFDDMPYAPEPFNVCPCCGTEFGVDNRQMSNHEVREKWINAGMPWFSDLRRPAKNWSPSAQLIAAGFGDSLIMLTGSLTKTEDRKVIFDSGVSLIPLGISSSIA